MTALRRVPDYYEHALTGFFATGAAVLAVVLVLIVYDVAARNLGFRPFPHTLSITEYGLLYMTMLGAPWLVRNKHHIYLQVLTALVGQRWRARMAMFVYLVCATICALLCYYSVGLAMESFVRGDVEIRSFDMPRWVMFCVLPLSFFLMTIEFLRFLLGFDQMFDDELGIKE